MTQTVVVPAVTVGVAAPVTARAVTPRRAVAAVTRRAVMMAGAQRAGPHERVVRVLVAVEVAALPVTRGGSRARAWP